MLEIIITSSILILAILLIRKICWGKISRRMQYGLWILVAIRLLVPAQFLVSPISIMQLAEYRTRPEILQSEENYFVNTEDEEQKVSQSGNLQGLQPSEEQKTGQEQQRENISVIPSSDKQQTVEELYEPNNEQIVNEGKKLGLKLQWDTIIEQIKTMVFGIYIVGIVVMTSVMLVCNIKFQRMLCRKRKKIGQEGSLNVYLVEGLETPCMYGVLKPAIYLNEAGLSSEERTKHILVHEGTHYRQGDHIWTLVRSFCLTLYWFHPLVWVAATVSIKDGELACDEGTLKCLGEENRLAYGKTLIDMAASKSKRDNLFYCATSMANYKNEIKQRIMIIANGKKPVFRVVVVVLISAVVLAACTGGKASGEAEVPNDLIDQMQDTSEPETNVLESSESVETTESISTSESAENSEIAAEDGKMLITILMRTTAAIDDWENNLLTQAIEEQFDVECEFIILPNTSSVGILSHYMKNTEDLPDMVIGNSAITNSITMELAEAGIITPIENYVLDSEMTPYFNALPEAIKAECLRVMKQADGHIYGFADYESNPIAENPEKMWINSTWLEKLDLEVPKTTEELKEVLIEFRDKDPNGNGIADEIGIYGRRQGFGQDTIVCLMNSFLETSWNGGKFNSGLAIDQQNGEKVIAPFATEGWKEGLKYLNDLYEEGVLSPNIFTDDDPMYMEALNTKAHTIGVLDMIDDEKRSSTVMNAEIRDQFIYLAPLEGPEGYSWFPTRSSSFNVEVLFTCEGEKLEKCIAIQDAMYDCSTPESLGIIRQGRGEYGVDWTDDPEVLKKTSNIYVEAGLIDSLSYVQLTERPISHNWHWNEQGAGAPENGIVWDQGANLYEGVFDITTSNDARMVDYLKVVSNPKYVPKTLPVLSYTAEEMASLGDVRFQVISCVNTYLEECITGVRDVETSWDAYLAELEAFGLNKWLEIAQQAYVRQK